MKVYNDIDEISKVPSNAYVLLNNRDAKGIVGTLKEKGIRKILFQSGRTADDSILEECAAAGIEAAVGCPMMVYGKGMHKLHAFFAGVR